MQSDPAEAQKRFKNDPDVDLFLREFGKVMSAHFEKLASQQEHQQKTSQGAATAAANSSSSALSSTSAAAKVSPVEEIGPLHADVMKRQKEISSERQK